MTPTRLPSLPQSPWSLADATRGLLVVLGVAILLVLAGGALRRVLSGGSAGVASLLLLLFLEGSLLLAVAVFGPWRYGRSWAALGLVSGLKGGAPLALVAFGGIFLFSAGYTLLVRFLGLEMLLPPGLPEVMGQGALQRVLGFLATVVAAPLAEEVFFRGFLLPAFAIQWGFFPGAVVTSVLFAFSHVSLGLLLPVFVSGLLLAWLYRRTGSLWNCVLAHGIQNGLAFSAVLLGP